MRITEVSPQKNNPARVNVYLDGEYALSLDDVDALVLGIRAGREVDARELKNLVFESQFGKARAKAVDILSRKSISSKSLRDTLAENSYDDAVITEVINELTDLGYIDDYSYALMFIEHAAEKMWGKKKIIYELSLRGIDESTREDAMESAHLPQSDEMAELIKSKYKGEDLEDYRARQRIMRFFASRGFDFSQIDEAIRLAQSGEV